MMNLEKIFLLSNEAAEWINNKLHAGHAVFRHELVEVPGWMTDVMEYDGLDPNTDFVLIESTTRVTETAEDAVDKGWADEDGFVTVDTVDGHRVHMLKGYPAGTYVLLQDV